MDRTGVVLLALVAVIVTCGPLSCVIFAKIRRHRKSHPGLRQLANARNQLTAVGGCSNSLGAERLAGSGWGTLGDRSTTTASGIGVGVGVGVGADGVLVESRTPQGANSSWISADHAANETTPAVFPPAGWFGLASSTWRVGQADQMTCSIGSHLPRVALIL
ncbi:hypothetical protein VDGE_30221 [Verticillium dahliae]|uniref:Uncharacterized protein n=1 Tax=Verticillium dahliae TaxID=27337 RepID=A0A444RTP5_VERDA|nr:hypothetical protein VDGE_30221 [Verticillium dahliae]